MTGKFTIDWAISGLSLFNIIVLLWLGLTVMLNGLPSRRGHEAAPLPNNVAAGQSGALPSHWGVWLMSGGLLAGALFFISHIAILGQAMAMNFDGLNFWWRVGWLPVLAVPYIWYVVVLWYGGYWEHALGPMRRRHRPWLYGVSVSMALLIVYALALHPLPAYSQVALPAGIGELPIRSIAFAFLLFPLVMVACVSLSIDVLLRPAQGKYPITADARKRSRPWLLATAFVLLTVSLLVIYLLARIADGGLPLRSPTTSERLPLELARFDLLLSGLLALASLLLGQAIVSYEIFTGRVLPRRTFLRHWRSVVILAAGYSIVIGWSLTVGLRPIYSLLLTTLLMAVFYALYSWRSFLEREQFIHRLRPFVQRHPSATLSVTDTHATSLAADLFRVLCRDVLGTTRAQLIPEGSAALLAGAPLHYPDGENALAQLSPPTHSGPANVTRHRRSGAPHDTLHDIRHDIIALQPAASGGYTWAIPLWSEREMIGTLLVADKRDGGLYSQEEIEIAQATGERIIATLTGEQVMRRLIEIESKRVLQQRVNDIQMRRSLHDEILPMLHLAALRLNALQAGHAPGCATWCAEVQEAVQTLTTVHREIAALLADRQAAMGTTRLRGDDGCNLCDELKALLNGEFNRAFDAVQWRQTDAIRLDGFVCEIVLGAAREVIRNAALHARGQASERPLCLSIGLYTQKEAQEETLLVVEDNGIGMASGTLSAGRAQGGSGSGLALHSTMLALIGSSLTVESTPDSGTRVTILLPRERIDNGVESKAESPSPLPALRVEATGG